MYHQTILVLGIQLILCNSAFVTCFPSGVNGSICQSNSTKLDGCTVALDGRKPHSNKQANQTTDREENLEGDFPYGYKLIKEETVEEFLDLEPEAKPATEAAKFHSANAESIEANSSKDVSIANINNRVKHNNDRTEAVRSVNGTSNDSRESRQIIRIDKPREDGRTRIIVSANQVRDKMLSISQHSRNQMIGGSLGGDPSTRVIRVPQRIIIAEGGMIPAIPNRKLIQVLTSLVQISTTTVPPADNRNNYIVPANHRQLAKPDSRCPKWGQLTLEHPSECDKYFYCEEGLLSEQTCPNGLVYGTQNTVKDYCIYRWEATCGDKSIPNPISSPGCRWQYGLFTVQGSPRCSQNYYECKAGKYQIKQCPLEGQVYDDLSKSCREGKTVGCATDALADFHCPHDDQSNHYWPFPRYFLNEKTIIHCINDQPELVKCNSDERVDPDRLQCVPTGDRVRVEEKIPEILKEGRNRMRDI